MNGGPVNCSPKELSQYIDFLKGGFVPCVNSEPCTCSPGQGAESLQTCCSDTSPSVRSRSMNIASRSYQLGKKMVAFHGFPYLRMSRNSTEGHGAGLSISSLEDFPVRTSVSPDKVPESTESEADSGRKWPVSLARFDPVSRSWKTVQPSLLGDSEECSVIWPRSGMTAAGQCWELDISGMITCEKESGLLPTPSGTSNHGKNHVSGRLDEWGGSSNPFRKTEIGKVHCASFEEWMMSWPVQWTALTQLETDRYRMWLRQHGGF